MSDKFIGCIWCFVVPYLLGGFIIGDFNPQSWAEEARLACVMVACFSCGFWLLWEEM